MTTQVLVPSTQALFSEMSANISSGQYKDVKVEDSENNNSVKNKAMNMASTITLQIKKIYGDIKYIDFLVPAILGMTVMMSCMMSMGQSVAGERETGELARLFMTPTNVSTVVAGKIIARLVIETGRAIVLLLAAMILFNIIVQGSLALTFALLVLTGVCFIGCAIMISARVATQEDYIQMVLPITMPMMFISGVFYPIETMPWVFQKLAYICPLTYANNALRGVMLQGKGLGDIWLEILVLVGFTLVFYIIGVIKFDRDV
jgi:ABC-2 type transport system permease protein